MCVATLHRFGLPYQYAGLESFVLPEVCVCCNAPLRDRSLRGSRAERIFAWQCHPGRCGGDGRRLQAHEKVKYALKILVLSNPNPGGCAFRDSSILIEHRHLRQDKSRPGDIVALGMGVFLKDTAMDYLIVSGLAKSCLSNQVRSSDFSLRLAEKAKSLK